MSPSCLDALEPLGSSHSEIDAKHHTTGQVAAAPGSTVPQQAKRTMPGCEETIRWALTAGWVVAQKGVAEQVEAGRRGGRPCLFSWVWLFALQSIWLFCFPFHSFSVLRLLTFLSFRLASFFSSCAIGQLLSAQIHLEYQVVYFHWRWFPQCEFTQTQRSVLFSFFRSQELHQKSLPCLLIHFFLHNKH